MTYLSDKLKWIINNGWREHRLPLALIMVHQVLYEENTF